MRCLHALLVTVLLFVPPMNTSNLLAPASAESLVGLVSGQSAYDYDLQLEKITTDPTVSSYSFRVAGSPGATAAANWLVDEFKRLGLESYTESFDFTTWNLLSPPSMILDVDGNRTTTGDQITLKSFMPKHMAWPTGRDGLFAQVVVLPLPEYGEPFPVGFWDDISIKGQIAVVGREFGLFKSWREGYVAKIKNEPPLAIVHTWWFSNFSWAPPYSGSQEGRLYAPLDVRELRYWDLKVPVGMVNYEDGFRIREHAKSSSVSAKLVINAEIGVGPHYNVIGKLDGKDPSKTLIFSSHYDTVLTPGFGDDGAGTAGLLELARAFGTAKREGTYAPPYNIMFACFTAEELWLIGSSYFVKQHKSELKGILGVINLDPIGSDRLMVSESPSNLDEVVTAAAKDLGTQIGSVPREEGSSDNWSFEIPQERNNVLQWAWGVSFGIDDATPRPAVWLGSFPLVWTDIFSGKAGWIHTPYDNSSSTQAHDWMKRDDFEAHLKVAALSALRLASVTMSTETIGSTQSAQSGVATSTLVSYVPHALASVLLIAAMLYLIRARRNPKR